MVKFTLKGISNLTESPAYFQQVNGIYRKDGALAFTQTTEDGRNALIIALMKCAEQAAVAILNMIFFFTQE